MTYLYQAVFFDFEIGVHSTETTSLEDFEARMLIRDRPFTGIETNKRLRSELQGQPKIAEMIGPMWNGIRDGVPVIRYESREAYAYLSH